jgi:hypothetical protein
MRLKGKFALAVLLVAPCACPYSVLTHEAIIDSAWDGSIKPLLLQRFPAATKEQLKDAHAYAYGGCIIQDMGYYPFGNKLFSDLAHYVRSGDFVLSLIRDSQDLNDYAFSLGALAHYAADSTGHPVAINRAVPVLYPKLKRKFGSTVTYEDNPVDHLKTEFGFDALQVAQGHYAPDAYRDFIGFKIAKPVLEKAFEDTYGLKLGQLFTDLDLALGTYRFTVSSILPEMTRVAWQIKKPEIEKQQPGMTRKKFLYNLSRASYRKNWDGTYRRPGIGSRILAFLLRLVPKVGPFRTLAFRLPTPQTEKMFMTSFDATLQRYRGLLSDLYANQLQLPEVNLDVGERTEAGQYRLQDDAYAKLLDKLHGHYGDAPPELRRNIIAFYGDLTAPIATKRNKREWQKVVDELGELKGQ